MKKKEILALANEELLQKRNLNIITELFSPDYIVHSSDKEYKGHEFIKRWAKQILKAFSDIRIVKIEFHLKAKDTIVWQRTVEGKFTSKMWGIEPSGKKVRWNDMVVSRFDDGKIVEEWVVSDLAGGLLSKTPKDH